MEARTAAGLVFLDVSGPVGVPAVLQASSIHGEPLSSQVALGSCSEFLASAADSTADHGRFLGVDFSVGRLDRRVEAHSHRL